MDKLAWKWSWATIGAVFVELFIGIYFISAKRRSDKGTIIELRINVRHIEQSHAKSAGGVSRRPHLGQNRAEGWNARLRPITFAIKGKAVAARETRRRKGRKRISYMFPLGATTTHSLGVLLNTWPVNNCMKGQSTCTTGPRVYRECTVILCWLIMHAHTSM